MCRKDDIFRKRQLKPKIQVSFGKGGPGGKEYGLRILVLAFTVPDLLRPCRFCFSDASDGEVITDEVSVSNDSNIASLKKSLNYKNLDEIQIFNQATPLHDEDKIQECLEDGDELNAVVTDQDENHLWQTPSTIFQEKSSSEQKETSFSTWMLHKKRH